MFQYELLRKEISKLNDYLTKKIYEYYAARSKFKPLPNLMKTTLQFTTKTRENEKNYFIDRNKFFGNNTIIRPGSTSL